MADEEMYRIMEFFSAETELLFRDISTPVAEVVHDELHHRFERMKIGPVLTPAVQHILMSESPIAKMEGIVHWVGQNPEVHAVKVFEIYDNLYCIHATGRKKMALPPSLRFICGAPEALADWEAECMRHPDYKTIVERYLYFLEAFWLPLMAHDSGVKFAMLRLLESKRDVDDESTTSYIVLSMSHAMGVFHNPRAEPESMDI
jgi:hypothetical protein